MLSDPERRAVEPIVPAASPRLSVAADAGLVAIAEPSRIVVASLPALDGLSEIGVDADAVSCEAGFVGDDRLLVVTRYAAHALAYLIDPAGPRKVVEVRVEAPVRLLATSGEHALLGGPFAAMLVRHGDHLEISRLPMRIAPAAAAGLGGGRFLVHTAGTFEQWDGASRAPTRRFRLARPVAARAVGLGAQCLWWIANTDPTRIETVPSGERGQPRSHVLPEPIAGASGHPDVDAVLAIGAETHRVYVVELGGDAPAPLLDAAGVPVTADDAVLAADRRCFAVVAARGRATTVVPVAVAVRPREEPAAAAPPEAPDAPDAYGTGPAPDGGAPAGPRSNRPVEATIAQRLIEWRDRMRASARPAWEQVVAVRGARGWRDELVAWAQGALAGAHRDPPPPAPTSPLASLARLGLPPELVRGVALAYAGYLMGGRGLPFADLARALDHRWDEALGRGALAASGALRWRSGRAMLAPPVAAFLDERAPVTGVIVGAVRDAGAHDGPIAVVAPGVPLERVAERCAALVGAVLVPRAGVSAAAIRVEAQLREARPIVDAADGAPDRIDQLDELGDALVRVDSPETAAVLGLAVLATLA